MTSDDKLSLVVRFLAAGGWTDRGRYERHASHRSFDSFYWFHIRTDYRIDTRGQILDYINALRRFVQRITEHRETSGSWLDILSDLRYLLNCCWLLVAMRGSRWRHKSAKKTANSEGRYPYSSTAA
jgi:hypothetical protein